MSEPRRPYGDPPCVDDAPLYCERCRRVTPHYPFEPPDGTDVEWICDECALIDALVDRRSQIAMEATDERWRTNRP